MYLKKIILTLIIIEVTTKQFFAEGLQCYVCEDCDEYEDFKELHICGEIPITTTIKPITMPDTSGGSSPMKTTTKPITVQDISSTSTSIGATTKPTIESSSKPPVKPSIDDYIYEDSAEAQDEVTVQNTKAVTAKTIADVTTMKPTRVVTKSVTEIPSSVFETPTAEQKTTTQSFVTTSQRESNATNTTTITSTIQSKPTLVPDYDDYLEYEDPIEGEGRNVRNSLLKINQPVCYMIKYHVNNTVLTNRGCTTFIHLNKYLTCQSLYNGAPMDSCRICSSNGCNKFLGDEDGEGDNHGIYYNAASVPEYIGVIIVLLGSLLSLSII